MAKFVKVAFKKDMINVSENGGQPVWYDCDPKAKGFAKSAFHEGDEVELVTENRGGKTYVVQVRRPGQGGGYQQPQSSSYQQPPASQGYQQPPAQNAPAQEPPRQSYNGSDYAKPKTPEETEKIVRQSVMAAACQAVTVLTGQLQGPDVLADVTISLYHKLLAEVKK